MATATPEPAPKVTRNYTRTYRMMWNALNSGVLKEHHFRTLKASVPEVDYQTGIYNALKRFTLSPSNIKTIVNGGVLKHPKMYKKLFRELTIENMKTLLDQCEDGICPIFQRYVYTFAPLEVLEYMLPRMSGRYSHIWVRERIFTCRRTRPSIVAWRIARNYHMRDKR
jgi:hypothetical protein